MKPYWMPKILIVLFLVNSLSACRTCSSVQQMEEELSHLEQFTYAFGDASVPPPFHRSYTIVVLQDSINVIVDSYGDTLAQKGYPMPKEGFNVIADALVKHKIAKCQAKKKKQMLCTGGTTQSIAYTCKNNTDPFSAYTYHCNGQQSGTLLGNVDSFLVDISSLTPDLKDFIQSTRK